MQTQQTAAEIQETRAEEAADRTMHNALAKHSLASRFDSTVDVVSIVDIPAPINAMAWAIRSVVNDLMWNTFTAFQNQNRKPATAAKEEDLPDYLKAMLTTDMDADQRPEPTQMDEQTPVVRSSWMQYAEAYKFFVDQCMKLSQQVGIPLTDRVGDDGKVIKGMFSYIRTPAMEADKRSEPVIMNADEERVLIPDRFKSTVAAGTQTARARANEANRKRNDEAAKEITSYLSRCEKKLALQPHEAYTLLLRFKEQMEAAFARDLQGRRLMEFDGTLKEEALGEMHLAEGLCQLVELEMKQLVHDHGDTIITH